MGSPADPALPGRKIVLCVTGGIAAYKAAYLARTLTELGADVRVVMTASARHFVGAQTFAGLTGNHVLTELFSDGPEAPHVELARGAEAVVVAPATANSIAKMAAGTADDLFSATVLMARCPLIVAPAMHVEMWENPATQRNIQALESRGVIFVGPESGPLMSGDVGTGRMAEQDEIVSCIITTLGRAQSLAGRRVVVTAGGTQEPIDPVRFIGNRSSGLMGFTVARAAQHRGAKVTLIAGPTQLFAPAGIDVMPVRTSDEMREAVLSIATNADVIVKAAAVADFKPTTSADKKLKKAGGPPDLTLVPTHDILAELGAHPEARKPGGLLVGFAAETEPDPKRLAALALDKLKTKRADVMIANDVLSPDSGFSVATNRAVIADASGTTDLGLVTKATLAEALMDRVADLLVARERG